MTAYSDPSTFCIGPDTANVNGVTLNGTLAKTEGMKFAISKVTQGTGFVDPREVANHHAAVAAGLFAGVYHFGQRGTGAADARAMLAALDREGIDVATIMVAYDCELQDATTGPSISDVAAFGETFKAAHPHHPLGLYTGGWYWIGHLGNPNIPDTFDWLWDSFYVNGAGSALALLKEVTPGYWSPFGGTRAPKLPRMRQYTSSAVAGGLSRCDVSVFDGTLPQLKMVTLPAAAPAPTPKPKPTPPKPTPKPAPGFELVEKLQRAVHVVPAGHWNAVTDAALIEVRGNHHDRAEQHAVGTPVDGIWGPISEQHYVETVQQIQGVLAVKADGDWGPKTDAAFVSARNHYYGK